MSATTAEHSYSLATLRRRADRLMIGVGWFLFVVALALAPIHGTWGPALLVGLPTAVLLTALSFLVPGSVLMRAAVGAGFMVFAALHIHQGHGLIELHFGIFALLAVLLFYRDWTSLLVAAVVIAVHHLSFDLLQASGAPVYLFNHRNGFDYVLLHAAYVVVETGVLMFIAWRFTKETQAAAEVHGFAANLVTAEGRINLSYRDAAAKSELGQGFNHFMVSVAQAVQRAHEASHATHAAVDSTLQNVGTIGGALETQVAQTDHVATAVNEQTATNQEVARLASRASDLTQQAQRTSQQGVRIVDDALKAINTLIEEVGEAKSVVDQVAEDSRQIGAVLTVIREITDQTNLLALNAAIEAARAGEAGRGFAVVADEVRSLAGRTARSTEEIQGMIERLRSAAGKAEQAMARSVDHSGDVSTQSQQIRGALGQLGAAIDEINDVNHQVATATEEQGAVSEEINRSMHDIRDGTGRIHDLLALLQGKSRELESLAVTLEREMGQFQVD